MTRLARHLLLVVGIYTLTMLFLGFVVGRAGAHDIYSEWKMPDNPSVSCCNEHDCRPVKAASDIDGNWVATIDGRPVPIPRNKIMRQSSPDGRSHWCGVNGTTYCFVPGEVRG